ncbi:glycosyltransferase [Methylocaldum marinum]|uniref:Glycosyltransferase n=1 Tax=Methylocaldum marinum TaxID=1432792 RepID=A0A250KT79_9GAMM|nr:glycosyltransferase [Methylocaldum marinum]
MWVKDRGKSEGRFVMDRIGDETIAPTRKGADFRVVAYREIGLSTNPRGDGYIPSGEKCVHLRRNRAGVVQW